MTQSQVAAATTLAECPVGLFWYGDELCFKSEYGNSEGRIDAFIVSSGEFFWGHAPQTITSQRATLVMPVSDEALVCLSPRSRDTEDRTDVVRRVELAIRDHMNRHGPFCTPKLAEAALSASMARPSDEPTP